jgi:hypothetical protein
MSSKNQLRPHPAAVTIGAVILALAVAGLLTFGQGGEALASHVRCGEKTTTDTRLDIDLVGWETTAS